ncbi:MAG: hypothetical protein AAFO95_16580 [Cyanobacteria bacterium J06600_6]
MQKSKQVFSVGQQTKFQQLQLEITALEKQVENALQKQSELTDFNSYPIHLNYVDDRIAKSGIKLTQTTAY